MNTLAFWDASHPRPSASWTTRGPTELVALNTPSPVRITYHVAQREPVGAIGVREFRAASGMCSSVACVYLPGRFGNSNVVFADASLDLRIYLAARGIPVFAIDYRTHFLADVAARIACATWDTDVFLSDIAAVVQFAVTARPNDAIVLVGHSMGATLAYLYVAQQVGRIAGLVALDGGVFTPASVVEAQRWKAPGPADVLDLGARREPVEHGDRVRAMAVESAKGVPARPSARSLVRRLLLSLDRSWPGLQVREIHELSCGGGPRAAFVREGLARTTSPVLLLATTSRSSSALARCVHTARLCRSAARTEVLLRDFAHLQFVVSPDLVDRVCAPVHEWLRERARPCSPAAPACP